MSDPRDSASESARRPEPPRRITTWWERLRIRERGTSLGDPSRGRGLLRGVTLPPGRVLLVRVSSAVFAVVGVGALVLAPIQREDNERMRAAEVCTAGEAEREVRSPDSPSCLVPVPGAVDDYREGSGRGANLRWHFRPGAGSPVDDSGAWVRFRDDSSDPESWSPVQRAVFSGNPVVAYYWGEDPVLFETSNGRLETTQFRAGAWTALLWVGAVSLALAGLHPFSLWIRRLRHG